MNYRNNINYKIVLLLLIMSIFSVINATAEQMLANETLNPEIVSGLAIASGSGDSVNTTSSITVNGNISSGYAISEVIASNGSNATAEAEVKTNYLNIAIAYAYSKAEAITEIGETIYVYAISIVSASSNSEASSKSIAIVSEKRIDTSIYLDLNEPTNDNDNPTNDNNNDNPTNDNNNNPNNNPNEIKEIKIKAYREIPFFGMNFGNNSVQRYCLYEIQSSDDNETIRKHAEYWKDWIATNYEGYRNTNEFEVRYNITYSNCIGLLTNTANITNNRIS